MAKNEKPEETALISLNDLVQIEQKAVNSITDNNKMLEKLGQKPAKVLILLLKNSQMSEVDAYQKVYGCTNESAYKNFRRITKTIQFIKTLDKLRAEMDNRIPTKDILIELLWNRGRTSLLDIGTWKGKKGFQLKDPSQITPTQAQMIKTIQIKRSTHFDEHHIEHQDEEIKIQMHDAFPNLKLIADYLGITKQVEDPKTTRVNNIMIAIQEKIGVKKL